MAELFVNLLKTSLSGGVIILLIMLLRLVFRKTPKALICLCWMVAILRLLLPFHIETSWSLQPSTAVLTNRVRSFQVPANDVAAGEVHSQITYQQLPVEVNGGLDTQQILGIVWMAGTALMLGCALASYLRLRRRVGECVKLSKGIYWCPGLDTAFLFGYFRPRIYLPEAEGEATRYICLHEQAHLRRGDHWLMLAGYLALCLHWFNPLVWLSYICLCRDIESACDERVIRTLNTEERKEYANALLSCGKHRSFPVSCPVAFGEVSIKQRIMGVLNYRKPTLWVCILLLVALVGVGVFFLTDPVEYPPYYMELMNSLGDPITEVYTKLRIDEADVSGDPFLVETPVYVQYAGITFQLHLFTSDQVHLHDFAYQAVLEDNEGAADEAVATLARQLYKLYGPGVAAVEKGDPDEYKDITAEEIAQKFKSNSAVLPGPASTGEYWDITDCDHGKLQQYLAQVRASEQFEKTYVRDYPLEVYACFMVKFSVNYDPNNNTKLIYLRYMNYADWASGWGKTYATNVDSSK